MSGPVSRRRRRLMQQALVRVRYRPPSDGEYQRCVEAAMRAGVVFSEAVVIARRQLGMPAVKQWESHCAFCAGIRA